MAVGVVEGGALHNVGPDVAVGGEAVAAGAAGVVSDRSVVRVEEGLLDRGDQVCDVADGRRRRGRRCQRRAPLSTASWAAGSAARRATARAAVS